MSMLLPSPIIMVRLCAAFMPPPSAHHGYHPHPFINYSKSVRSCSSLSRWNSLTLLRGGANQQINTNRNRFGYATSTAATPPARHLSAVDSSADLHTEALLQTIATLNDSNKNTAADFGGLKYWNTASDSRFRVLFVLGGPGAGKGTQSARMEQHYPVAHFSVGELLRSVPHDSPHKHIIEQTLVAGQIVPVEISLALLKEAMEAEQARVGRQALCLVDGFPRNFDNLEGWCRVMAEPNVAVLESVLVYQCPLHTLQQRILERAQSSGRTDDNMESVRKRFATFEQQTLPVVETLRTAARAPQLCDETQQRWSVVDIAGDRTPDEVWGSTQQVLDQLILHDVLTANAALLDAVRDQNVEAYRALCDNEFFADSDKNIQQDPAQVMQEQEGTLGKTVEIQLAQVEVISGRNVAVSYNRKMEDGIWVREKRFWAHEGYLGWRNVHFQRTPVPNV